MLSQDAILHVNHFKVMDCRNSIVAIQNIYDSLEFFTCFAIIASQEYTIVKIGTNRVHIAVSAAAKQIHRDQIIHTGILTLRVELNHCIQDIDFNRAITLGNVIISLSAAVYIRRSFIITQVDGCCPVNVRIVGTGTVNATEIAVFICNGNVSFDSSRFHAFTIACTRTVYGCIVLGHITAD